LPKKNNYVIDSFALIGYLEDESFAQKMETLLRQAEKGRFRLYMHVLHLGEVYYISLREKGQGMADLAYRRIKRFPVQFIETINEGLLLSAATLKARYPISYADAFAAALARVHHAALLTGDPEFRILEQEGAVDIYWLV
jgi:ribonuclease VapC